MLIPQACKSKKEEPSPQEIDSAETLAITYASPQGKTGAPHEYDSLVVIFDHPVIALEAISEGRGSGMIRLEPSVAGRYRWLNPKTLSFTPDEVFPFATELRATVPAGTKALDGYILKEDFTWTFQTLRPRLLSHFPRDEQGWLKPDTEILLVFNQPIQKSKSHFVFNKVEKDSAGIPVEFSLKIPSEKLLEENGIDSPPEYTLLLQPRQKLLPDSRYTVEIAEGLPGKQGTLGMEESVSFYFDTYTTFVFYELDAGEKHNPRDSLNFSFSNPVPYNAFIQKIHFEPEVTIPDYYAEWEQSDSALWLNLPLQPETRYKVQIDAELQDIFGNTLPEDIHAEFATAAYSPSFSMNTRHRIVEAYSDLTFPLYVINVPEISVEAARLTKEEVLPLLANRKIFRSNEKFAQKNLFSVRKKHTLPITRNRREVFPLRLKELFPEKYGMIFLQVDNLLEDEWSRYPKAMLQLTELGLTAKFSPDNNVMWVTELRSGRPAPDVAIEVRDDSNKIYWRGKTDAEGKAESPGWKALGIESDSEWSQPEQWVFASRGDDFTFISSEWDTGLSPYQFDIPFDWNPKPVEIQGYVFTERGLYRAGEKVHIKGIIRKREKGEWKTLSIDQVECEVLDPFSNQQIKKKVNLDAYSSFDLEMETSAEASLGTYPIKVTIPPLVQGDRESYLYSSFRMEAFRPAEFEVHLKSIQEEYIFGDNYKAEVRASYMFGGAMAAQKVSWHLRLNQATYSPPGHKGYVFGNQIDRWERYGQEDSRLLSSGEGELDAEGKFKISAELEHGEEKNSVFAALEATVQGPSRRTISSRIQTIVHSGEYYIGLQPSTTFLPKGEELTVRAITVLPGGKMDPGHRIDLRLIKREWNSVRKAGIGGRYRWISETVDTVIETKKVKTVSEPQTIPFTPEKAGFYLLEAEGKDRRGNPVVTKTYVYVTGSDYIPWDRQDEDIVELIPDSSSYKPGDVAKILVKSPYERANALITVEREFVLHTEVKEIIGSSSQIEIPVRGAYLPNVYVSVLLVQGRTTPKVVDNTQDLGKPSFKLGYAKLVVDPAEKRLSVAILDTAPNYKPGEEVTFRVKVNDADGKGSRACVAVAVVDLGVLNLIGYKTPDPFSAFYGHKPLAVNTSDARPFVLEQLFFGEKGEDVAGGLGDMMARAAPALSEIELRGDFRFTAFWDPSLETDDGGEANVTFKLPDNLTTFRVMAVAQTQDSKFGRSEAHFKVTKPLLLQASLPRFARVGDTFSGGIVVHNQTTQQSDVVLQCEASGIKLTDEKDTRNLTLAAGASQEVLFAFEAEQPGMAELEFRARMGEDTDGLSVSFPLKLPRPVETVALHGEATEPAEEKILVPEDVFPEESQIEFTASASAFSGLEGSVDFLTHYPYLCLEQRVSSILPYIVAEDLLADFKLSTLSPSEMKEHVKNNLEEIAEYQRGNGGFGLWTDSRYDSPFNSCYAAFALAKAKEAGYAVDNQTINRLISYLKNAVRGRLNRQNYPYGPRSWKTIQAFALYALALFNQPEPSFAEQLFTQRETMSLFGKTLLLKALNKGRGSISAQNTLIQELMNKAKVSPTSAHFEDDEGREGRWIYASNNRTSALILQSLLDVGTENPLLSSVARWLVDKRKAGTWTSTQENFYVFYALSEYYGRYERIQPDFKLAVSLAGKSLLDESFKTRNRVEKRTRSLSDLPPGKTVSLKIDKKGEGRLYYQTRLSYAPTKEMAAVDQGFSVIKDITTLDGKPLETIRAGTMAVVTLQVILPQESLFVVLDDPLPAGFEAVNPAFQTESEEQRRRLEELTGSRRWRWWQGFNHIEMHDDRVLLFADSLTPGIHTHRYLVRALTYGSFTTPGAKIEEMYSPEVFGRSEERVVKIVK
jgi:uncharacterized protein YfaS (alpha-2-macroglobulin family)